MKKNIKILLSILLSIGLLFILNSYVYAANTSLSAKSTKVKEGDTITVTASVTAAQWDLALSVNGKTIASSSELDNYKSNITKTFSGTYKATSAGTVIFTLLGDITDVNQTNSSVNKTVSVTVEKKASSNTSGGNTSSSSNSSSNSSSSSGSTTSKPSNSTTTAPKFTSVNQTVYATDDGINVRSSYSTSSSVIGSLKKGDSLKRTGIATTTINGIKWSKVIYNGQTAYVSSAYLTTTKPVVEEPKKEEPKVDNTTKNEISNNETTSNNEILNNINTEKPVENNEENSVTNTTDEELRLSKLQIAGVNFSEGFNPEIFSYTLQLNFFVKDLNITAEANKTGAKVEIIGNENFKEGENNITILVTSADMKETLTYQIKVIIPANVATSPQNDIQFYLICGSILIIAIVIIIIITIIAHKSKKEANNMNEYSEIHNEVQENNFEEMNEKVKTKKSKGGKHLN